MRKTFLKMQMSITTMGLAGKETMSEEETSSCAGNVVQVFGFKNKFPREAGYNGISRKPSLPLKKDLKSPKSNFCKLPL